MTTVLGPSDPPPIDDPLAALVVWLVGQATWTGREDALLDRARGLLAEEGLPP